MHGHGHGHACGGDELEQPLLKRETTSSRLRRRSTWSLAKLKASSTDAPDYLPSLERLADQVRPRIQDPHHGCGLVQSNVYEYHIDTMHQLHEMKHAFLDEVRGTSWKGYIIRAVRAYINKGKLIQTIQATEFYLQKAYSSKGVHHFLRSECHCFTDFHNAHGDDLNTLITEATQIKLLNILCWMVFITLPGNRAEEFGFCVKDDGKMQQTASILALPVPGNLLKKWKLDVSDLGKIKRQALESLQPVGKVNTSRSRESRVDPRDRLDSQVVWTTPPASESEREDDASDGQPMLQTEVTEIWQNRCDCDALHYSWLNVDAPLSILGREYAYQLGFKDPAKLGDVKAGQLEAFDARILSYFGATLSEVLGLLRNDLDIAQSIQAKLLALVMTLTIMLSHQVMVRWGLATDCGGLEFPANQTLHASL